MRLCTVSYEKSGPFFGLELKKKILRVQEAGTAFLLKPSDVEKIADSKTYFENLPASEKVLRELLKKISEEPKTLARPAEDGLPYLLDKEQVTWHPPVLAPRKILCIGLNYRDHCEEQNREVPKKPVVFNKFATSLIGHGEEIPLPLKVDKQIDYEAEFAIVIGKKAKRVTKRTAMKHVGGYTMMNDVSARKLQSTERQWARAKGFDGSGPCGPVIVTPDEIPDPHDLKVMCYVNGELRQKSNTSNLVFGVAELISFISQAITLEPGDIISTGTPGGVGVYSEPQLFLQPGDVVEVKIDRLGTLRNVCTKG